MSCLYYYKLNSGYQCDVSKQCKLTINEIDSNFYQLKSDDIVSADLDEENKAVVLTRNNGEQLVVDLTPILSGAVYDLEITVDNPSPDDEGVCNGMNVYVSYSTLTSGDVKERITVPITGIVTTDNISEVVGHGDNYMTKVITDGTLGGDGTIDSPLGIKSTEKDRPAVSIIDKTKGEELPETFTKGTRYISKEYVSEFGYLYNYYDVEKINEAIQAEGKGWRVPTKADWDCLLNSIEPCDYRNHDTAMCHQVLGKYAGTKLKSDCGWLEEPDCECKITKPLGHGCEDLPSGNSEDDDDIIDFDPEDPNEAEPSVVRAPYWGTDDFGMRILPTGYGDGKEIEHYFNKSTVFWTTTHVYNDYSQDIYVKEFDWDKSGVLQEAQCPDALFSLRLVKDFDGNNHQDVETIDGDNYQTILFQDCNAIWTATNFKSTKTNYTSRTEANMGQNPYKRAVYFINDWNGTDWDKRLLSEGETVVIMEGNDNCQYNVEYRIFMEDDCNQILVNTDDIVVERVLERVMPILDNEREERIAADNALSGAIDTEREERIAADEQEKQAREDADALLQTQIDNEVLRAKQVEQELWDGLNQESQARESVDAQLWDAINNEFSARTDVDNQIWTALNDEINARLGVEAQLWQGINGETARAQEVEGQLWGAINAEASARTEVDNQLWEAVDGLKNIGDGVIDGSRDYVINTNSGSDDEGKPLPSLILYSKVPGVNDITIMFNGNYGTF